MLREKPPTCVMRVPLPRALVQSSRRRRRRPRRSPGVLLLARLTQPACATGWVAKPSAGCRAPPLTKRSLLVAAAGQRARRGRALRRPRLRHTYIVRVPPAGRGSSLLAWLTRWLRPSCARGECEDGFKGGRRRWSDGQSGGGKSE